MTLQDRSWIISKYERRLDRYGVSADALCWENRKAQELRFQVLFELGIEPNTRVLDIGCGFGDFYGFLCISKNLPVEYEGFDISQKLLDIASYQYPGARFRLCDILESACIERHYDFVVSSGVLNHRTQDNMALAEALIGRMFDLCTRGIAVNMTSLYKDSQIRTYQDIYYYKVEDIASFCLRLTRFVTIRHDYPLPEFTAYLYKEPHVLDTVRCERE